MKHKAALIYLHQAYLAGSCTYSITSTDPNDVGEDEIEQTASVPARAVRTSTSNFENKEK